MYAEAESRIQKEIKLMMPELLDHFKAKSMDDLIGIFLDDDSAKYKFRQFGLNYAKQNPDALGGVIRLSLDLAREVNAAKLARTKPARKKPARKVKESIPMFPHLQMLAEAKKKPVDDMEMDFSTLDENTQVSYTDPRHPFHDTYKSDKMIDDLVRLLSGSRRQLFTGLSADKSFRSKVLDALVNDLHQSKQEAESNLQKLIDMAARVKSMHKQKHLDKDEELKQSRMSPRPKNPEMLKPALKVAKMAAAHFKVDGVRGLVKKLRETPAFEKELRKFLASHATSDVGDISSVMGASSIIGYLKKLGEEIENTSEQDILSLLEGKKKKAPADDMEMDFSSEEALEAPEDKAESVPMGKKEILAALKDCSPKDRAAIHTKLMSMVEADDAEK